MAEDMDFMGEWLTEGGLDQEPVTFRNAKFDTSLDRLDDDGNPVPFLSLDIVPDNPDVSALEEQRLGIGKGWVLSDDGSSITRDDGKKMQYNKASKAGKLVTSLLEDAAFRDAVKARHASGDPITPFDAAFYEGIKATIHANTDEFKGSDGEMVQYRFFTVTDFTGYEGAGSTGATKAAGKKAAAKKPASKKAAAKKPEVIEEPAEEPVVEAAATGGGDDLRAKFTAACEATEVESHDEWMVEMYETYADDLTTDEAMALVDDPAAIWETIWG